jgi:hypothetical protein
MSMYRVSGDILLESTHESAMYDVEMEWDGDSPPDPISILDYLMQTGDIQIIPSHWEEVDE